MGNNNPATSVFLLCAKHDSGGHPDLDTVRDRTLDGMDHRAAIM